MKVHTGLIDAVIKPDLSRAAEVIRNAVAERKLVVIVGVCRVDYEGRSESKLTSGERIIVIKQDGAFLVHRPTGHSPVNWQPDTSRIEVRVEDSYLIITAIRRSPREIVRVYMDKVYAVLYGKLVDKGEFIMYLDELEIRDLLYSRPDIIEEGLRIIEKEKKLDVGSIDLFGYDRDGRPVIIEIKRVTASREAVYQLLRYVESYQRSYGVKPRGILVAPQFSQAAIEALARLGLEYRDINIQKLWRMKKSIEHAGRGRSILDFFSS